MQQLELAVFVCLVAGSLSVWTHIFRRAASGRPAVPREPRICVPWIGVDVFLLFLAWFAFESIALKLWGAHPAAAAGNVTPAVLAAIVVARVTWTCVAILYLAKRTSAGASDLGLRLSHLGADIGLGLVGFLAAALPVYGVQLVVSKLLAPQEHSVARLVREQPSAGVWALAALSAVIVAPLAEELLFRVVLQGWLERQMEILSQRPGFRFAAWSRSAPVLASSAAFAILHMGYALVPLFVLALFLGYLYQQTHRIWPSLVLHACVNGLTVAMLSLGAGEPG